MKKTQAAPLNERWDVQQKKYNGGEKYNAGFTMFILHKGASKVSDIWNIKFMSRDNVSF